MVVEFSEQVQIILRDTLISQMFQMHLMHFLLIQSVPVPLLRVLVKTEMVSAELHIAAQQPVYLVIIPGVVKRLLVEISAALQVQLSEEMMGHTQACRE